MEEEWYRNCERFSTGEDGCDETYLGLQERPHTIHINVLKLEAVKAGSIFAIGSLFCL